MTMYASKKINTDPYPWVTVFGPAAGFRVARDAGRRLHHDWQPRHEFDNNPNPVLLFLRESLANGDASLDSFTFWLGNEYDPERDAGGFGVPVAATPAHIDHALRVLEHLAHLSTTTEENEA